VLSSAANLFLLTDMTSLSPLCAKLREGPSNLDVTPFGHVEYVVRLGDGFVTDTDGSHTACSRCIVDTIPIVLWRAFIQRAMRSRYIIVGGISA
jgi:hypothetical protein